MSPLTSRAVRLVSPNRLMPRVNSAEKVHGGYPDGRTLVSPDGPFVRVANVSTAAETRTPSTRAGSPAVGRRIQSNVGQFFLNSAKRGKRQMSKEVGHFFFGHRKCVIQTSRAALFLRRDTMGQK